MPLPWTEVNRADAQTAALLIELPHRPRGERRKWGCPFCGSSDSLHAYPGERGCFGCWAACGAGQPRGCRAYSVVDVAARHWGTSPAEACSRLAGLLGVVLSGGAIADRAFLEVRRAPASGRDRNLARLAEVPGARYPVTIYADLMDLLRLTLRGGDYLRRARGLDPRAGEAYGYRSVDGRRAWSALAEHLVRAYGADELRAAGFPTAERSALELPFGGRLPVLVIPFVHQGRVVGLRFRSLLPDRPEHRHNRYRSLKDAPPPVPYNVDAIGAGTVHVHEGELNAETLRQMGEAAVGAYGAGGWLPEWTPLLAPAARVVAWFDPNRAGDAGASALRRGLVAEFGEEWTRERWFRVRKAGDANELHRSGKLGSLLSKSAK